MPLRRTRPFTCVGSADSATLLPNYLGIIFQEDQPGYLAGIVAARRPRTTIGAIGGINLCGPCVHYMQGYEIGAKSIKPDIEVRSTR